MTRATFAMLALVLTACTAPVVTPRGQPRLAVPQTGIDYQATADSALVAHSAELRVTAQAAAAETHTARAEQVVQTQTAAPHMLTIAAATSQAIAIDAAQKASHATLQAATRIDQATQATGATQAAIVATRDAYTVQATATAREAELRVGLGIFLDIVPAGLFLLALAFLASVGNALWPILETALRDWFARRNAVSVGGQVVLINQGEVSVWAKPPAQLPATFAQVSQLPQPSPVPVAKGGKLTQGTLEGLTVYLLERTIDEKGLEPHQFIPAEKSGMRPATWQKVVDDLKVLGVLTASPKGTFLTREKTATALLSEVAAGLLR